MALCGRCGFLLHAQMFVGSYGAEPLSYTENVCSFGA